MKIDCPACGHSMDLTPLLDEMTARQKTAVLAALQEHKPPQPEPKKEDQKNDVPAPRERRRPGIFYDED